MKLRMRQNSIRLRLTKSEVALFEETGYLEEAVLFPSGTLRYVLKRSPLAMAATADLVEGTLTVSLPEPVADSWSRTTQVGIEAQSGGLDILVEKDFQCAHGPADSDAFAPEISAVS